MNREEAIEELKTRYLTMSQRLNKEELHKANKAIDMAIKALEQEPCKDAISRQAAIDAMATWDWQELYLPIHFKQLLEELPSVSTEKTGHWVKSKDGYMRCDYCGSRGSAIKARFCHHCGAKMEVKE